MAAIQDPLSQLVAAGVLFRSGRATPGVIATAVNTASERGWRRPLLAWLGWLLLDWAVLQAVFRVDPDACRAYARKASERLDKRLADEAAPPAPKATP